MKVTIENKKGLEKDLKVFVDKKTISGFMDEKYEEIRKDVVIKGLDVDLNDEIMKEISLVYKNYALTF